MERKGPSFIQQINAEHGLRQEDTEVKKAKEVCLFVERDDHETNKKIKYTKLI